MKYMGSKDRIAKYILPLILQNHNETKAFVEPFAGGMNLTDKVKGKRLANDINYYLIEMWKELQKGWIPPKEVSKELYLQARDLKLEPHLIGYIGINCSYSGKWFGGYAGKTMTNGGIRDYQLEAYKNVMTQLPKLMDVDFTSGSYLALEIPPNSTIYCDPPYKNTTTYKDPFNHTVFYNWCREQKAKGHSIFLSEYTAPEDFKCIWEKHIVSSLSANGSCGGSKSSVERLFTL